MQALPGLTNRCLLVAHYGNYWPYITARWKGLGCRLAQGHLQVVYLCWAIKNLGVIRSTTALWLLQASCSLTIWSFICYLCDMFKHHLGSWHAAQESYFTCLQRVSQVHWVPCTFSACLLSNNYFPTPKGCFLHSLIFTRTTHLFVGHKHLLGVSECWCNWALWVWTMSGLNPSSIGSEAHTSQGRPSLTKRIESMCTKIGYKKEYSERGIHTKFRKLTNQQI